MFEPGKWYAGDGWQNHDYKSRPLLVEFDRSDDLAMKYYVVYHHCPEPDSRVSRWLVIPE